VAVASCPLGTEGLSCPRLKSAPGGAVVAFLPWVAGLIEGRPESAAGIPRRRGLSLVDTPGRPGVVASCPLGAEGLSCPRLKSAPGGAVAAFPWVAGLTEARPGGCPRWHLAPAAVLSLAHTPGRPDVVASCPLGAEGLSYPRLKSAPGVAVAAFPWVAGLTEARPESAAGIPRRRGCPRLILQAARWRWHLAPWVLRA